MSVAQHHIDALTNIVGLKNALTNERDQTHYTHENRDIFIGKTPLVLKPGCTDEVSGILAYCNEHGIAVVPQGGHTGHVGGGVPDETGDQIIITTERMKTVRDIDPVGNTMTLEAGVTLQTAQDLAAENNRLFPLSIGSKGSCQIGGNIATNAGGTGVLAFGNMREQVMGLEVVLPNGEIWNGLRRLKKDNTGYDLKNLFAGSEGTLGIITAAVLKMRPAPKGVEVGFIGLQSPLLALRLFQSANELCAGSLTGFEIMPRVAIEFVTRHMPGMRDPLSTAHPWYVLMEISSNRSAADATEMLEQVLYLVTDDGVAEDAVIAQSEQQAKDFWSIRENIAHAQKPEGGSIKHDVSVPVHLVPEFMQRADEIVLREIPDARICAFGHLGDGNIHYNISQPAGAEKDTFLKQRQHINDLVHALVVEMEGSISAEHGIGKLKRELLSKVKSETEMNLMRSIKATLDPKGIMNPGKVI